MLVILGLVLVAFLVVLSYVLTLQRALSRVSPHNRLMEPELVWLLIVPCVQVLWQFIVAIRLPGSLQKEFRERGRDDGSNYGKSLAFSQAVLSIAPVLLIICLIATQIRFQNTTISFHPIPFAILLMLNMIFLVIFLRFWSKIASYSNQLTLTFRENRDWESKFDEPDDDDYGSGRRGSSSDGIKEGDPGRHRKTDRGSGADIRLFSYINSRPFFIARTLPIADNQCAWQASPRLRDRR